MGHGVGLGVGSPLGRGEGRGAGTPAKLRSSRLRWLNPFSRAGRRGPSLPPPRARAPPSRQRRTGALQRFSHRTAPAAARRAGGGGPGVQRGPWWGPAPRPGRMRPLAARELSRAPAPAPAGPGLRSRSHRRAPERHDFQAAFRLDSLQVRGRRPRFSSTRGRGPPPFNAEDVG